MNNALEIRSLGDAFIIKGDFVKILNNRFAMMYLRRQLSFEQTADGIIVHDIQDINTVMNHVKTLAKYVNCQIVYDEEISEDIKAFENEEVLFAEFSEKARDIRDNHPSLKDLEEFKESLIENMKTRQLYFLQLLSAFHMAFAQNSCNFSVPGAGKTSVVYGAYCYLKNLPQSHPKHVDRLLIIGPLSSFGPWENEFEECFGFKPVSKRLIGGISKKEKSAYLHGLELAELTITSYQSVITMVEDLQFFLSRNKVMIVLDEAHKIKNTNGAITAASTMSLAKFGASRVVLTGTPAPNGYEDLYNMFKFIWPERNVITYNVAQLENMSHAANDPRVDDLIRQISPFFIRVKKSDLLIPEATYTEIRIPMSEGQRTIYDAIEAKVVRSLEESTDSSFLKRIRQAKLIRLMQAATNPVLLNSSLDDVTDDNGCKIIESEEDKEFLSSIQRFIKDEVPEKFKKALELTQAIVSEGGKVIVWASYIKNIEMLCDFFTANGIAVRKLYGATPVESSVEDCLVSDTRESIVREFNSDHSSFNVIVANPFAVAESISLHKKCHNAIYLERSFNAAHFIQSKDRIHRYGLPADTVTRYYYLITENSVDETINERLLFKERRLNEIMESMPIPLFDNTLEDQGADDIKAILKDYAQRAKKM